MNQKISNKHIGMAKTKNSRPSINNNNTRKRSNCDVTMNALIIWYKTEFEKIGWMILAKSKPGMKYKLATYLHSLNRLERKLKCKMEHVELADRKEDLYIMWNNVKILKAHAKKDLM
jgi:hypothetical protein